ncbi:hypothetical protein AB0C34_02350 [Nocardia sp. NPDC049220]|uniref:hypothetical protein n=1 Tax=Nocardia sp. NPDC049220 TaxID=3155273 RepID=UPI0033E03B27
MDFVDAVLTVGLPTVGAFVIPGPVGGLVGGAIGGAIGGVLDAKWHHGTSTEVVASALLGGVLGGFGGRFGGKLGAKLLDKVNMGKSAGWLPANTFTSVWNSVSPRLPQTVLAGAGGWLTGSVVPRMAEPTAAGLPSVRKPGGLAPEVDHMYDQLPAFFGRTSSVLVGTGTGQAANSAVLSALPASSLQAPNGRSGIPNYDAKRSSLNDDGAAAAAKDQQVATLINATAANSATGHNALVATINNLNRQSSLPPKGMDANRYYLGAIDTAVHDTQQILNATQAANIRNANSIPA